MLWPARGWHSATLVPRRRWRANRELAARRRRADDPGGPVGFHGRPPVAPRCWTSPARPAPQPRLGRRSTRRSSSSSCPAGSVPATDAKAMRPPGGWSGARGSARWISPSGSRSSGCGTCCARGREHPTSSTPWICASRSPRTQTAEPADLREGIELVGDTRLSLTVNVSEELALESLAYRLQALLAGRPSAIGPRLGSMP